MEKNINPEINKINMDTSKRAAKSMSDWEGTNAPKKSVGGSFLNGSTSQNISESKDNSFAPAINNEGVFSFGLIHTISALKNSPMSDLPAGKIMLEKYEYLLLHKGISEAFVIEEFTNELKQFSWETSVNPILENVSHILESRKSEIEVIKTYENIRNTPGRDIFSDATSQMKEWLSSENRSSDNLIYGLKQFGFNPMVRNLINFLSIHEGKTNNKFNVGFDNEVCEVSNIYSPVAISESDSIFYTSGKFFKVTENEDSLTECSQEDLSADFINKIGILSDNEVSIGNNKVSLKIGNSKLDIVSENETKRIFFDGKEINEKDVPVNVSVSTSNMLGGNNNAIAKAIFITESAEDLIDIDFGKKIKSKVYENVEANIFKLKNKIYVQTVNPGMKLNKLYETNATQAIKIIKDFINFDISESLTEFLEGDSAIISVIKNDKIKIVDNITILENELRKIDNAMNDNQLLRESKELITLQESIEGEIKQLKDKFNQVNLELTKFENKPNDISINEEVGYSVNTQVRIKRNGTKGKVIGVDDNSKTYTIIFENGKTGEYFFSDVENLSDEVENFDISTPEIHDDVPIEDDITNEGNDNQELAEAPDKTGKSYYDKVFMSEYQKNLSKAPSNKSTNKQNNKEQKGVHIEVAPDKK